MGFGLLLVGYTIAYLFSIGLGGLANYAFAGFLIGYFLCYLGLSELKKYSPAFNYALIISMLLTACGLFETVVGLDNMLGLGMNLSGSAISYAFVYIRFALDLAFNLTLLYAEIDISKRVDFEPTRNMAYRNMIFVAIAFAFEFVRIILGAFMYNAVENIMSTLTAISVILKIFYIVLNIFLWFKSYAFICPSEDVDMKRKESKIGFINKINEKNDRKEQENMELARKMYEDRLKKKKSKKKNKH